LAAFPAQTLPRLYAPAHVRPQHSARAILSAAPAAERLALLRRVLLFSLLAISVGLLVACSGSDASDDENDRTASVLAATPAASPTSEPPDLTVFNGFTFPIAGGCLPESDQLMPNAPREYRSGVHEGVDFYSVDNCTTIEKGTPAVAAKDGVVVRADDDYHPLTQEELATAEARIAAGGENDFQVLDVFRGRQVWIDHGKGVVTRYAHLSAIPDEIRDGVTVAQGQTVGFVGDSGTPESISSPGSEIHLHWELRAGDGFLGAGLPPEEVRAIYERLFAPTE
jgi:murein DD-endopeptidase MepM/ murein hydrolase activator NlpD